MNGKLDIDHCRSLKRAQLHWLHTVLASAETAEPTNEDLFLTAAKS